MENLQSKPWFRPELSRDQAEQLLLNAPNGDFVIRSSSQPNCVALSYKDTKSHIDHALIVKNPSGGYKLTDEETTYPTLQVLLEACDKTLNIPRESTGMGGGPGYGGMPGRNNPAPNRGIGLPPPGGFPKMAPPGSQPQPARATSPAAPPPNRAQPPMSQPMSSRPPASQPPMSQPMSRPPNSQPPPSSQPPMNRQPSVSSQPQSAPPNSQPPPSSQPPPGGRAALPGMAPSRTTAAPPPGRAALPGMSGRPPTAGAPPGRAPLSQPPGRAPMGQPPRAAPPPQSNVPQQSVREQFDDLDNLLNDLNSEFG